MEDYALQDQILRLVSAYRRDQIDRSPGFVPGETYLSVTAKLVQPQDLARLVEACLEGWLTAGRFAQQFENALSKKMGTRLPALFVNSGSSANLLATASLCDKLGGLEDFRAWAPGDEVITSATAFPTTLNPIIQMGLVPVFVDVDLVTLNIDLASLDRAWSERTRGVILAHTLGNPFRADLVREWCHKRSLHFIEDCCDALGAQIGEEPVGSFGDFSTLSFYPAHHITTGEGGALMTSDAKLRRVAESLRDWGRDCWCDMGKDDTCGRRFDWEFEGMPLGYDHKYIYSRVGYNLKATDMQAALGLSQLDSLPDFVARRRENWAFLRKGVSQSPLLSEYLRPVEAVAGTKPSWFGFAVHLNELLSRRRLCQFLESRRIGTRAVFAGNITRQPAYKNIRCRVAEPLIRSDKVMEGTFWLGVHPGLGERQLTYVLESLESGIRAQIS